MLWTTKANRQHSQPGLPLKCWKRSVLDMKIYISKWVCMACFSAQ